MLQELKTKLYYMDENFNAHATENDAGIALTMDQVRVDEHIVRVEITCKNNGAAKKLIPVFEVRSSVRPDFYMIPCVTYNGNTWGTGEEPKGMERDGEPWIFSSDRVGVPGCSVAEDETACIGVFSDNKGLSANASASVYTEKGETVQRIYFSHVEYPKVFLRKYYYGDADISYLPFANGEEKRFICYVYRFEKQGERYYGYKALFDFINSGYYKAVESKYTPQQVKDWTFEFLRSLTELTPDGYLSNMGLLPGGEHRLGDENSTFIYRKHYKYESGWCGQNFTVAEMYLRAYLETKNPEYLEKGVGILDTWLKHTYDCGLITAQFDKPFDGTEKIDSCNEGWTIYKLIYCCELLNEIGMSAAKYEEAAKRICEFYINTYPDGGFPQIMNADGSVYVPDGCAGTMVLVGFLKTYEYFRDEKYLSRAKKAFDFYYDTYLSKSQAAGGALDTYCIDKESAGPVLRAALLLYELTNEKKYFDYAENIAHYLMTWCFYHDVVFDDDSDCAKVSLRTTGGTSVSAAHHHIDCWGVFYAPEMVKLYELTGNEAYLTHARALWTFTVQFISDGTLKLHGMVRPIGSQNEGVLQCNWGFEGAIRGLLNDWLVTWIKTFQMDVYYALKDTEFFKGV